jgi:hypothetical protein
MKECLFPSHFWPCLQHKQYSDNVCDNVYNDFISLTKILDHACCTEKHHNAFSFEYHNLHILIAICNCSCCELHAEFLNIQLNDIQIHILKSIFGHIAYMRWGRETYANVRTLTHIFDPCIFPSLVFYHLICQFMWMSKGNTVSTPVLLRNLGTRLWKFLSLYSYSSSN